MNHGEPSARIDLLLQRLLLINDGIFVKVLAFVRLELGRLLFQRDELHHVSLQLFLREHLWLCLPRLRARFERLSASDVGYEPAVVYHADFYWNHVPHRSQILLLLLLHE